MSRASSMPLRSASLILLLFAGYLGRWVLSICPSMCTCSGGHRIVDCSLRGLTQLPPGLQHNIHFLNLSFNSLQDLHEQLSLYVHLRTLDLSYNHLGMLPSALPRSLWEIRASGNLLHFLDKKDTAYHWNLKVLDLSDNKLERVVFINNTMLSLTSLNLSHNKFWTVPTNLPHNLECIDLSHNYLVQILPGSLDRLPRLVKFYLHGNRFTWLSEGIFNKLTGLEVMTLGGNPWACEEEENITKLVKWAEQTRATVLGCPCYTKPICGQAHLDTTDREWHSALFTESSFWMNSRADEYEGHSPELYNIHQDKRSLSEHGEHMLSVWASSTSSYSFYQHTSTTEQPLSSTKNPQITNSESKGPTVLIETRTLTLTTVIITAAFTMF